MVYSMVNFIEKIPEEWEPRWTQIKKGYSQDLGRDKAPNILKQQFDYWIPESDLKKTFSGFTEFNEISLRGSNGNIRSFEINSLKSYVDIRILNLFKFEIIVISTKILYKQIPFLIPSFSLNRKFRNLKQPPSNILDSNCTARNGCIGQSGARTANKDDGVCII